MSISGRTALLAKPNLHRAGPGGKKHIKGGAKHSSLSLSPAGVLLHSLLFFEDGFSCYLLNKIDL